MATELHIALSLYNSILEIKASANMSAEKARVKRKLHGSVENLHTLRNIKFSYSPSEGYAKET